MADDAKGYWTEEIPVETPHLLACQGGGEWSVLYVDGREDRHGDHYLIDERIRELAGVVTIQTDDFMQGGDTADYVADTVDKLRAYREARLDRERRAEDLRRQAAELIAEADRISR